MNLSNKEKLVQIELQKNNQFTNKERIIEEELKIANNFILKYRKLQKNNSNDFEPAKKYGSMKKNILILWLTLCILGLTAFYYGRFLIGAILYILSIFIVVFYIKLVEYFEIIHWWDDMDYDHIAKHDLPFSSSDGLKHFAYLYHHIDVNFDEKLLNNLNLFQNGVTANAENGMKIKKYPVIIAFHGYKGHHRIMDRYCLPLIRELPEKEYMLISYDARGHGQTGGNPNDFLQFRDAKEFINYVKQLPFVDKDRIAVVGMSLGASKISVYAYEDPEIKLLVFLSGTFDLELTRSIMSPFFKIAFKLMGFPLSEGKKEELAYLSGINHFKETGIELGKNSNRRILLNSDRVFIAANLDDKMANPINSINAIMKLGLPRDNYRLYKRGKHIFRHNEWLLSAAIFNFVSNRL